MAYSRRPLAVLLISLVFAAALGLGLLLLRPASGLTGADQQLALGESLFRTRCATCHAITSEMRIGPGLAGLFQSGGPSLPAGVDYAGNLPNGLSITDTNVANFIRQGGRYTIGAMPGFDLTDSEIRALITYLRTLKR